jgi:hypothetical protein
MKLAAFFHKDLASAAFAVCACLGEVAFSFLLAASRLLIDLAHHAVKARDKQQSQHSLGRPIFLAF